MEGYLGGEIVNSAENVVGEQEHNQKKLVAIDLFSGGGGFHIGFERAGFKVAVATDNDDLVAEMHRINYPHIPFIHKDIHDVSVDEIKSYIHGKELSVLVGGPPCQGFSTLGIRASPDPEKRKRRDPRNQLFMEYIRILKGLKPKFFVYENVRGLLTMNGGKFFKTVLKELHASGYTVDYRVLDAVDYGVPQYRKRVIIIGNRIDRQITFPGPTHFETPVNGQARYRTVGQAIMDLVDKTPEDVPNHVPMRHRAVNLARYKMIPEGGRLPEDKLPEELYRKNFGNTFKRLDREKSSLTMVPGHSAFPIHPTLDRSLTVREAARLQGFPDNIVFVGPRTPQGLQVGNAVPPPLSEKIALHIKHQLENKTNLNLHSYINKRRVRI